MTRGRPPAATDALPTIRVVSTLMSRLDAESWLPLAEMSPLALRIRSRSAGTSPTSTPSQVRTARRSSAAISAAPSSHGPSSPRIMLPANWTWVPPGSSAEACWIATVPSASASCVRAWRITPSRHVRVPILRSTAAVTSPGMSSRMSSAIVSSAARAGASSGGTSPSSSAVPSVGRKRSRSSRLRSISATRRGTSPPCQESAPLA